MLVTLNGVKKARSAAILAVFYLLCVLAPAAGYAFGDSDRAAHCLTEATHQPGVAESHPGGVTDVHVHKDGATQKHSQKSGEQNDDGRCCGLVCLTALPATNHELRGPTAPTAIAIAMNIEHLADRAPDRLYRPPISLLFV